MIKKETIKNVTKMALQTAAYIGSGAIAGAYIATAPFSKVPGRLMNACIWVGGAFLQDLVATKAADHAEQTVDNIFAISDGIKEELDDSKTDHSENLQTIVFDTPQDAKNVLDKLCTIIHEDGCCSVADYYEMCAYRTHFIDTKWGWRDLTSAESLIKVHDGYIIDLPKPIKL